MKGFLILLLTLAVYMGTSFAQETTSPAELYFASHNDIMRLRNGSSTSVFVDLSLVEGIDCNVCDQMVYWIDGVGRIQKANPSDPASIQTIMDERAVREPRGLAVDWIGNNVYFSHNLANQGLIEVITCDGRFRRAIKSELGPVGPLAIDVTRGYVYYVFNMFFIHRMTMGGSDSEEIIWDLDDVNPIVGLDIDVLSNTLYWANSDDKIKYVSVDSNNLGSLPLMDNFNELEVNSGKPRQLAIHENTLYWAVSNQVNVTEESVSIVSPGGLYAMILDGSEHVIKLLEADNLSPQDLCYFFEANMPESGCAVNNGGCDQLCLTVPATTGGTVAECVCSTGLVRSENTCPLFPNQFLLYTNELQPSFTEVHMISLDVESPYIPTVTPVIIPMSLARHIAYDITLHEVYWSQLSPPSIRKAALNGAGETEIVVSTSISHPLGLAVDPYDKNLFWLDSKLDKIEVISLENGHRKVIVRTGLLPQGLALDLTHELVYWTDLENGRPRVERCHLDGSGQTEISDDRFMDRIKSPTVITVDPETGNVYWAETGDEDRIHEYNYETGEHNGGLEIGGSHPNDITGLAVLDEFLYWCTNGGSDDSLGRVFKNNLAVDQIILPQALMMHGLHSVVVANEHEEPVANEACAVCSQLCLPDDSSGSPCRCADNLILTSENQCSDPLASISIATDTSLYTIVENSNLRWSITPNTLSTAMDRTDIHIVTDTIYWINFAEKTIYRSPLDSLSPTVVVGAAVGQPADLAVDWFGSNLYWIDSELMTIEVAKLNGAQRIILYKIPVQFGAPDLLVLDPYRGYLYWSPKNASRIYRVRMDGTSVLDESTVPFWEDTDPSSVFGLAMKYNEFPGSNDQLYFGVNNQPYMDVIKVFGINVDDPGAIAVSFGGDNSRGLALTTLHGDFYILSTEDSGYFVKSIQDQGSNPVDVQFDFQIRQLCVSGSHPVCDSRPTDLNMLHFSTQPGEHECSVGNNECGSSAVCLVEDGVSGNCVCSPLEASGETQDPRGVSHRECSHSESFVMVATSETVYYLPVPSESSSYSRAQALPIGSVFNITTLSYDPITRSALVSDSSSNLHRVALDSSSSRVIPLRENIVPSSLAYDWKGGHVFYSKFPSFQIELATINGDGVGSVLDIATDKLYQLNFIGQLAFDSEASTLYWTYSNENATVHYINLLSPRIEREIDMGDIEKNGVITELSVFQENGLLWVNKTGNTYRIEKYFNSTVSVLHTSTDPVKGLAGTLVAGKLYVFWFSNGALYYHNGTVASIYLDWAPEAPIVGMLAHTQPNSIPIHDCLGDERPCSHYCLEPNNGGYQCGCPVHTKLDGAVQCSSVECGALESCGGMYNECFPSVYWCDNIPHCRNGADEECECSPNTFACWKSDTCVPMSAKCNGVADCANEEDEEGCCMGESFGCYVEDANLDVLGGGPHIRYRCLINDFICDGNDDCINATIDEPESCDDKTEPPAPVSEATLSIPIIITAVVVICVFIATSLVLGCYFGRLLVKRKKEEYASNSMARAFNSNLSNTYKPRDSPQIGGGSVSDYWSELSNGTLITGIESTGKGHSEHSNDPSNPPPSPMTYRPSPGPLTDIEDTESVFSETISEFPIPPVPNPSLNYDIVSDSQSYSVSHSQYPATITGRNPLMQRPPYGQQPNYSNGGYTQPPQWTYRGPQVNGNKYPYSNGIYHYPKPREEIGSLAQTETESTLSMTTVSTENRNSYQFEECYAPPGRPPSPVTIISDYQPQAPPMSPDSTLSEFSDDQCSERHLHQT